MTDYKNKDTDYSKLALETKLVRGGSIRSNFGETSEAIFLNSGFAYNSAETAEKRFNGDEPGYVYSRYLNPSLKMLEDKLAGELDDLDDVEARQIARGRELARARHGKLGVGAQQHLVLDREGAVGLDQPALEHL